MILKNNPFDIFGILDTWVVGVQYNQGAEACAGREVIFERDPNNPFDTNAIAVLSERGEMLGHVPRYDAEYFSPLILEGMIALKGHTGVASPHGDRVPLRLEVHATDKIAPLLQRDETDDWRAICHNTLLDLWARLDAYSAASLKTFREKFRPIAHREDLYPKTQFLYRMLKAQIQAKQRMEQEVYLDRILEEVAGWHIAPPAGWPEFSVAAIFTGKPEEVDGVGPPASTTELANLERFQSEADLYRQLVRRCSYPQGARGFCLFKENRLVGLEWFESPECAQVVWYMRLVEGMREGAESGITFEDKSPENIRSGLLALLEDPRELSVNAPETESGRTEVFAAIGNLVTRAVFRQGGLVELRLRAEGITVE